MRVSRNPRVSWLQTPFCQPFPTQVHRQRLCCTARDAPSGLSSFICSGSERVPAADPEHTAPVWRKASRTGSLPLWPRRSGALTRHGFEDCQREHRSDVRQKPSGFSTWHQKSQGRWGETSTSCHLNYIKTSHLLLVILCKPSPLYRDKLTNN